MATENNSNERSWKLVSGIVAAATLVRIVTPPLLGHPSSFSPIGSIALFSGACFRNRKMALAVSFAALLVSDVFINMFYLGSPNPLYRGCLFQYLAYGLTVVIGRMLSRSATAPRVVAGSAGSAVVFFIVSNFGVWATSGMYPLTSVGLIACYVAGIPFFAGTLASFVACSLVMFMPVGFKQSASVLPAVAPVTPRA